ncbi:MAG: S24/S26 family peptidase [Planctomycetes bacterium]|nr:S24/S26 family peptidase [Planctomycetota bacterium]
MQTGLPDDTVPPKRVPADLRGEGTPAPASLVRSLVLEALANGKTVSLGFGGGSMSPLLAPGDTIRVGPAEGPPRPGDIVLYLGNGTFVAHRVLRAIRAGGREGFLVKGDFTAGGAEVLSRSRVLGLVLSRDRRGRRLNLRTRTSTALGLLAARASPWAVPLGMLLPRPLRRALKAALFRLAGFPR